MNCCMCDSDYNTLYTFMPKLNHIKKNLFHLYIYIFFNSVTRKFDLFHREEKKIVSLMILNYTLIRRHTALDILIIRMLMLLIFLLRINTTFRVLINMISIVENTGHEFCSRG